MNIFRSTTLWAMKTAYRGMNNEEKQRCKEEAAQKYREYRMSGDYDLADMWAEFYQWTNGN